MRTSLLIAGLLLALGGELHSAAPASAQAADGYSFSGGSAAPETRPDGHIAPSASADSTVQTVGATLMGGTLLLSLLGHSSHSAFAPQPFASPRRSPVPAGPFSSGPNGGGSAGGGIPAGGAAPSPAPVPEASPALSLGLLLALGGVVMVNKRRKALRSL